LVFCASLGCLDQAARRVLHRFPHESTLNSTRSGEAHHGGEVMVFVSFLLINRLQHGWRRRGDSRRIRNPLDEGRD
jgi:hypothetical protein